jgi:hypothetical protein
MPISYKLVGVTNTRTTCTELDHKDWDSAKTVYTRDDAMNYFDSLGLKKELCTNIKFITNAEIMTNEKSFNAVDKLTVYVFSQDEEIKKLINKIFQENGHISEKVVQKEQSKPYVVNHVDKTISKPLEESELKITKDIIDESNKMTVELFKNNNFKSLLKIFYEDPDIYKTFASYVTSGDMMEEPFDEDIESNFDTQVQEILSLGVLLDEDIIRNSLKRFNGHINLSLRYLLTINSLSD